MIIARKGSWAVGTKTYLDDREPTTKDIELVRYEKNPNGKGEHCMTVACFSDDGDGGLIELEDRLTDALEGLEDGDDLGNMLSMAGLGKSIVRTTESVPSGLRHAGEKAGR